MAGGGTAAAAGVDALPLRQVEGLVRVPRSRLRPALRDPLPWIRLRVPQVPRVGLPDAAPRPSLARPSPRAKTSGSARRVAQLAIPAAAEARQDALADLLAVDG